MARVTERIYKDTRPPSDISHPGLDLRIQNSFEVWHEYYHWDIAHKEWLPGIYRIPFPENGVQEGDTVRNGGVITEITISKILVCECE